MKEVDQKELAKRQAAWRYIRDLPEGEIILNDLAEICGFFAHALQPGASGRIGDQ